MSATTRTWIWALTLGAAATCAGACSDSGSGAAGSGGTGGSGASAGSGGGSGSPGSVTLKLVVPSTKAYCQQGECGPSSSISIRDSNGNVLLRDAGDCYTPCDTCASLPCPGYACQPMGYAVTGESLTWDGTYYTQGTCGSDVSCRAHTYAQPGKYMAVMCATPGTLAPDANLVDQCTKSEPSECVEVPFDFPSAQTVTGTLPG